MEKIIKNLKERIKTIKRYKADMEGASWNYEEGIIISGNEAQTIVDYYEKIKKGEIE